MVEKNGCNFQRISHRSFNLTQCEFGNWKEEEILCRIHLGAFVYFHSSVFADGLKKLTKPLHSPNIFKLMYTLTSSSGTHAKSMSSSLIQNLDLVNSMKIQQVTNF